jgi:hypothetical protein
VDGAALDGPGCAVEADREGCGELFAARLALLGLAAGGMLGGPNLGAVLELGEGEDEGDVGFQVAIVVDADRGSRTASRTNRVLGRHPRAGSGAARV